MIKNILFSTKWKQICFTYIYHQNSKRQTDLQPSPLYLTFDHGHQEILFSRTFWQKKKKEILIDFFINVSTIFLTIEKYRRHVYFICVRILPCEIYRNAFILVLYWMHKIDISLMNLFLACRLFLSFMTDKFNRTWLYG